jgi:hypothetical protein
MVLFVTTAVKTSNPRQLNNREECLPKGLKDKKDKHSGLASVSNCAGVTAKQTAAFRLQAADL